ncbi:MAG: hypothetical protein KF845_06720 [Cyclobacteriaceae bacterium]|nr:hypothetical protein [Cyclobacteriaceae bacterium]
MSCTFRILSENEHGYIGQCLGCSEFNFVYKNILVTFSEDNLLNFGHWLLDNRNNPEFYFVLPNGRSRVYNSPIPNLFLAFNDAELDEVSQLFSEVKLLLEARKILDHS